MILYAVYYIYNHDEKISEKDTNTIVETEAYSKTSSLRLGISNLDTLNPVISKNQNVQDISKLIYEPLFDITKDFKLENKLATEWSKVDAKTYLVSLRENVKWQNGSDFVCDDVIYTVNAIKSLGENSIYFSNVSNIEHIETVGSNIIKIFLYEEKPFFEYNLTFPIICHSFFGDGNIADSDKNNIPLGTGKYMIKSVDVNSAIELKQNQSWWGIKDTELKVDTITVRIYPGISELYNAYKLGGLDMITAKSLNIEDSIGTIGSNTQEYYGREFDYLALNCTDNLLSKKEVRQAINYGIDRKEIINTVYAGKYKIADFPLSYGSYLYEENKESIEMNQEKAKQFLQDSGWTLSKNVWQKKEGYSTLRLKLNLVVQSENENRVKVANIIKEDLEKIGIQVTIISAKDKTFENYLKNKNYDMILTGVTVRNQPRYK